MTDDQIIARGLKATRLLANEDLMSYLKEYEEDIKASAFNKQTTDTSEQVSVFHQLKAVWDVLTSMAEHKRQAEDILNSPNKLEETYDD